METVLVTGGAGFIGGSLVRCLLQDQRLTVVNLDKLTYAANLRMMAGLSGEIRHVFVRGDIADQDLVARLLGDYRPRAVFSLAAESHVDRSIKSPREFLETNTLGVFRLLDTTRAHWAQLPPGERESFRFIHISTDEVFGALGPEGLFNEGSPYSPSSPYAASKAAADHFVRSYHRTYDLPALIIHPSNNYGPGQYPEKLIPRMIHLALRGDPLPVFGDGMQIRDWLYVEDHCRALVLARARGRPGESYNIGGKNERTNLEVVHRLCDLLDELSPRSDRLSYRTQVSHVADRPGHDRRYALDTVKAEGELGWEPITSFEDGLRRTVKWYLDAEPRAETRRLLTARGEVREA